MHRTLLATVLAAFLVVGCEPQQKRGVQSGMPSSVSADTYALCSIAYKHSMELIDLPADLKQKGQILDAAFFLKAIEVSSTKTALDLSLKHNQRYEGLKAQGENIYLSALLADVDQCNTIKK